MTSVIYIVYESQSSMVSHQSSQTIDSTNLTKQSASLSLSLSLSLSIYICIYLHVCPLIQILVYEDGLETELIWVASDQLGVLFGAMVVGYNADNVPFYLARIYNGVRWYAGNYDRDKYYAEYSWPVYLGGDSVYKSGLEWDLLVAKYGTYSMNIW